MSAQEGDYEEKDLITMELIKSDRHLNLDARRPPILIDFRHVASYDEFEEKVRVEDMQFWFNKVGDLYLEFLNA